MRQLYTNAIIATAIFLLAVLMHYLRHETLILHDILSLGLMYAIGLVAAVLLGKPLATQTR